MSTFDAANHYFSGQGVMMIGKKDPITGNPTGLRPVGNVSDMKITITTTVLDHKGSQDGQRAIDSRLQTEVKVAVSVTLENWIAANIAKAIRGDDTLVGPGNVLNESIIGYPGLVSGFKRINVSAVVVKMGATPLTPYTDGTVPWDYKLNAAAGSIMINDASVQAYVGYTPSSPTTVGVGLTVNYSYPVQHLVDTLTQPLNDSWVRFEGLNTVENNDPVIVDVFRFSNDPLKELALLSDTYGQFVLEGASLKDDTRLSGSKYFIIRNLE